MSESADFIIKNGVFQGYKGPDVEVLEIPDGVTAIGDFTLRGSNLKGCRKIVFPASVKDIGRCALNLSYGNADALEELEFLGEITSIGDSAFDYIGYYDKGNVGLKKLTFHGKVWKIDTRAFSRAKITTLEFSAGVDTIGKAAFCHCTKLKEIHAPGLKKIGNEAFYGCKNLEIVDIPENTTIGEDAFKDCNKLQKAGIAVINNTLIGLAKGKNIPEGITVIDRGVLSSTVQIPMSVRTIHDQSYQAKLVLQEGYLLTDEKLGGKGLLYHLSRFHKLTHQESAALYLFQTGKQFEEIAAPDLKTYPQEIADYMVDLLSQKGKAKHYLRAVEYFISHLQEIAPETVQALYDLGVKAKYKKEPAILVPYLPGAEAPADDNDICAPWRKIFDEHLLDKSIKSIGLKNLDKIPLADGSGMAPAYLVKCAIAPYVEIFEGKPKHISGYARDYIKVKLVEDADKAAALLDREALQNLLETINLASKPQGMLPYCRYASGKQISQILSSMTKWKDWYTYGTSGRMNIIIARGALMLSDTREAMMHLDKNYCLDTYAKLRNTDADSIRDTVLADFGLDEKGQKTYDLGGKTVVATLAPDLTLHLLDVDANKVVKSLPKRGSDPDKHAAASADLSEMKKNLKKVVKGRNDVLFQDFLEGKGRNAASWKASYLTNPVLNMVGRLLVWTQGKNTFILTEDGAVDCQGQPYDIVDNVAIQVAHPIELSPEDVKAWQQFICKNGIVQPFEQMWEPARNPKTVSPDRYEGCHVSVFKFMRNEKHGIGFLDEDFHAYIGFVMLDCELDHQRTSPNRHEIGAEETFTLGKFTFKKYTRRVNHLVSLLDKWTMSERILKDDVTIQDLLDGFTMAQIMGFIQEASENQCTNVLAMLMEYKEQNFSDFDPMDEFSLDL